LYALAPSEFDRYFEPFLGGGALFFYLISNKSKRFTAYLSDINTDLINSYIAVKDDPEKLIKYLEQHELEYDRSPEEYYYKLRNHYNLRRCSDNTQRAAEFITLIRSGYNGLYRVNRNGEFNVPWGKYIFPDIRDDFNIRNLSFVLNKPEVTLKVCDYKKILENAKENDFIYLDPPYSPVSSSAYFTKYTNIGFGSKDQEALAEIIRKLDEKKCKFLLTNSNTPFIRELYAGFASYTVEVVSKRAINCKGTKRGGHTELAIRNYKL
jgi:DNA adenine methylase